MKHGPWVCTKCRRLMHILEEIKTASGADWACPICHTDCNEIQQHLWLLTEQEQQEYWDNSYVSSRST